MMQISYALPEAFSAVECGTIVALARAHARDAGLVRQTKDHNIRRAEISWLDEVEGSAWVMDRILRITSAANREAFDFDVQEFAESPQVARYGAEREGHFDWHSDIGSGALASKRKLTMVVQLSDAASYEGGTLEVWGDSHVREVSRQQGSAVFFPSFILHRVTPVTSGERHSLTVWAHGPAFR